MPNAAEPTSTAVMDAAESPLLKPEQQEALLSARAWWQEGDRALDYLAERARQEAILEQIQPHLERLRDSAADNATADLVAPILRLTRRLSANRALNRARETDVFARALHHLLFSPDPLPNRLNAFLAESGVGEQTASQMLYVSAPDRFPLVSHATRAVLASTPRQRADARERAMESFGLSADQFPRPVVDLLGDFALYEAARRTMGMASFVEVNAILWHAREMPPVPSPDELRLPDLPSPLPASPSVREIRAQYHTAPNLPRQEADVAPPATETRLLEYIEGYIAAQGFTFPELAIRDYYVALKTKPFVILAGLSGTGKTHLTELFAEALTGDAGRQYRLIPVRPDWTDPTPLLGYHNVLTDSYVSTPFLDLLREAGQPENRERVYFVSLDEMNLARVEHYLADLLSAMETRQRAIPLAGGETLRLPSTVFLAGTVNVDEATHPFSKKVLDRANTIEFSEVNLAQPARAARGTVVLPQIPPQERQRLFLSARVQGLARAEERLNRLNPAFSERVLSLLTALNQLLEPRGLHFGYRVRDEVFCYAANAFDAEATEGQAVGLLLPGDPAANLEAALDLQVVQKALPRISGTQETLEKTLRSLEGWADSEGLTRTRAKLARMRRRAEEDGIVSFYEV